MRILPRFSAALFLGTLAGILAFTLHGAWLVHADRLDQAARSVRLHELGQIAVPHPELMAQLTWKDDVAAGLFYGLAAGWPAGGLVTLLILGLDLGGRRKAWVYAAALLLLAAVLLTEALPGILRSRALLSAGEVSRAALAALTAIRAPATWILLLTAALRGALALPPGPKVRCGFLVAVGLVLAFLLHDPEAFLPTALLALALPWIVRYAAGLAWRRA